MCLKFAQVGAPEVVVDFPAEPPGLSKKADFGAAAADGAGGDGDDPDKKGDGALARIQCIQEWPLSHEEECWDSYITHSHVWRAGTPMKRRAGIPVTRRIESQNSCVCGPASMCTYTRTLPRYWQGA